MMRTSSLSRHNYDRIWKQIKAHKLYLLLAVPGILYFLIFSYIPMTGLLAAFKDLRPFDGYREIFTNEFVGLKHFQRFFSSVMFYRVLGNTLMIGLISLLINSPAPLLFALALNEVRNIRFKRTVQTISYLPHFLSWVIVSGFVLQVLALRGGIIPEIVRLFGGTPKYLLTEPGAFRWVIILSALWKEIGFGTIIYLAAITSIDTCLYEAAEIDGAGRFRQLLSITLPSIAGVFILLLILRIGNIMGTGFEPILLMYNPAVYSTGDIIPTYVYRTGIGSMQYSFSIAVGFFNSIIGLIFMLSADRLAKLMGQEGIW